MEESLNQFCEGLDIHVSAADQYSPLTLAYIGDAVFDLAVRSREVSHANMQVKKLHRKVIGYVSAKAQAEMLDNIESVLTEKEHRIMKRGRNAKPSSMAKNASVTEYLKATGFEALLGYLYLNGEINRAIELIDLALKSKDGTDE